ncbi:MAG: hypothetical protein U9Q90_09780 [Campylobacterota bacterium]|nr:hypothetical protein [Campylobacterota bacterium]
MKSVRWYEEKNQLLIIQRGLSFEAVKNNKFVYDQEELVLLDEISNSEWIDAPLIKKESEAYAQSAAYTKSLQEKKQTTIRFAVSDLAIIKARAKEMGIGYQNLIQTLVHNYAHDKIKLGL